MSADNPTHGAGSQTDVTGSQTGVTGAEAATTGGEADMGGAARMAPRVVLVGPPGAGKSTVGKRLAEVLLEPFEDTDHMIEVETGKSIPDVFIEDGEPHFRELERSAVIRGLAEHRGVLALGGGAILNADTRADLLTCQVVFLTLGLAAAAPRVGLTGSRPLLIGSPRKRWAELSRLRDPYYREVADLTVATDDMSVHEVAEVILSELRRMEADDHADR